jgi:hypothetical protein
MWQKQTVLIILTATKKHFHENCDIAQNNAKFMFPKSWFEILVLKYGTAVSTFKGCKNYVFLIIEPVLKILLWGKCVVHFNLILKKLSWLNICFTREFVYLVAMLVYRIVRSLHGRRSLKSGKPGKDRLLGLAVQSNSPSTSGRELMIGCESESLSLKSEYAFNMSQHNMNASRKSKRELIVNSQSRARDSS